MSQCFALCILASKRNLCFFGKEQLLDATHEATQDEAAELREAAV